jgi:phage terminase large subunit-like protein
MSQSPKQILAGLSPDLRKAWLQEQPDWVLREIRAGEWWWTARPEQRTPPGDWFVWLLTPGRGFGKTRTGSEWLVDRAIRHPVDVSGFPTEHLLIAETLTDAMRQCVYGPAGVRRALLRRVGAEWKAGVAGGTWRMLKTPKPSIEILATGAKIYIEGADDEDVGRGYNAASAWLDEFAKWPKPDGSWTEGIMPGLRADLPGDFPRAVVTTTPKLVVQLIEWIQRDDDSVHVTHGSTYDNASNLAAPVIAELHRRYAGTRLGRQELLGELIMEAEGALWALPDIEAGRVSPRDLPRLDRIVIGMDPAGSGTRDESGIVASARGDDGHDYVLGDWSKRVAGREAARRMWEMYDSYGAHTVLYEWNQGQQWLTDVLTQAYKEMQQEGMFPGGGAPPMRAIRAKVKKRVRAEPVAMRYEQHKVHHVKGQRLGDLETQMISWVPDETPESPDRIDALVYSVLYLAGTESLAGDLIKPQGDLHVTSLSPLAGMGYGQRLPGAYG